MDAALQDFEVSAVRAWHVKVGKLVRCARRPMTDQHFAAVLLHLRILIVLLGFVVSILRGICLGVLVARDQAGQPSNNRKHRKTLVPADLSIAFENFDHAGDL
jgi:hypothetical protein